MKYILIALILVAFKAEAQKIGKNNYRHVDTVFVFKNARIVIYDQGKKRDTIWGSQVVVNIETSDELFIDDDKILKRNRSTIRAAPTPARPCY